MSTTPQKIYESLADALKGTTAPSDICEQLALVSVPYCSFEEDTKQGQLVVHKDLMYEVESIFNELSSQKFAIQRMVPIAAYEWDDDASMADNNTSAFNYRHIVGTQRVSNHSYGRAIDINPLQNPYFAENGKIYPNVTYDPSAFGAITGDSSVVKTFAKYGWEWLGNRDCYPDYQHFQKL